MSLSTTACTSAGPAGTSASKFLRGWVLFFSFAFFSSAIGAPPQGPAKSVREIKARGAKLHNTPILAKGCVRSLYTHRSDDKREYWHSFYLYESCSPKETQFIKVNAYKTTFGKTMRHPFIPKPNSMQVVSGRYKHGFGKDKDMIGALTAKEQK